MITQDYLKVRLTYDSETGKFTWNRPPLDRKDISAYSCKFAGLLAGSANKEGYIQIKLDGEIYRAHRLAILYMTGANPLSQVDHINGDRSDNRFVNLRCVNNKENLRNQKRRSNNTSGRTGVSWLKSLSKWQAQIVNDGKIKYLGVYENFDDAVFARKQAEKYFSFHENHDRVMTQQAISQIEG